jgi:hypothetical protein
MRRLIHGLILVIGGLLAGFVLSETALRVLGISYPEFYDFDPHLGSKLCPGVEGRWVQEGKGYVAINSDGLRDLEHSIEKAPGSLRIAVLGDSFAEAMQVDREEAFWAIAERRLISCGVDENTKVEMINFGQSGFGTSQELLALRRRVWKYSPDLVLLAFFVGNDISDNSKALKKKDYHPYHVYRNHELILDDSAAWKQFAERDSWWRNFYMWRLKTFRVEQVWRQAGKAVSKWCFMRDHESGAGSIQNEDLDPELSHCVYKEPVDQEWQEAWRVTEDVLRLMHKETRSRDVKFFVVVIGASIQVHPDPSTRRREGEKYGITNWFYPDRRIEKLCDEEGIPVLLLGPRFQEYAEKSGVFMHGFSSSLGRGHWNVEGHRLAGNIVADWLCWYLK